MNQKGHTVLLGSAGVGAAYASAKALRKNYNVKIVSVDTNPSNYVTTSLFSDKFLQIVPIESNNFEDVISNIIIEQNVDTYVPFIDDEVYKAALLYEHDRLNLNFNIQVKDSSVALLCMDKYRTYNWLRSNGYPTPDTLLIEQSIQLRDGFILKPRTGFGSKIIEIRKNNNLYLENYANMIMQEQCLLPEITIDVHYSKNFDFFVYACRERLETKSGVCTKARIFKEPSLGNLALNLAKNLNLSSFCFQVMTLNGEYVITDINPRLGAGTAMSDAVGLDFHSAMFANLWGENPEKYFKYFKDDKYVTRQYSEFIM